MKGMGADTFDIVLHSSMPKLERALHAIWAFRQKRLSDWSISKWKARLCPKGAMQQLGVNYWETHALVVNWSQVRRAAGHDHEPSL